MKMVAIGTIHGNRNVTEEKHKDDPKNQSYAEHIVAPGGVFDTEELGIKPGEIATLIRDGVARVSDQADQRDEGDDERTDEEREEDRVAEEQANEAAQARKRGVQIAPVSATGRPGGRQMVSRAPVSQTQANRASTAERRGGAGVANSSLAKQAKEQS